METGRAKESEHVGDETGSSLEGEEEWATAAVQQQVMVTEQGC